MVLPQWDVEADREQLQEMSDRMLDYGIISEEFDVETMLVD